MQLNLTDEEQTILRDVLSGVLSDLRAEVYKTENFDWREDLKRREQVIRGILDRLSAPIS